MTIIITISYIVSIKYYGVIMSVRNLFGKEENRFILSNPNAKAKQIISFESVEGKNYCNLVFALSFTSASLNYFFCFLDRFGIAISTRTR